MKTYILVYMIIYVLSTMTSVYSFDYTMASSIDTIYKREDRILTSQEALNKLMQVALSFWNSNTKAVLNFIKDEKNTIQSLIPALSFIQEAINLGQALAQSTMLADFENQYLLAAIVLDKITLISNQLQGKTQLIQFDAEYIISLKAKLTDLLDSLNLIKPKVHFNPYETATNIALQISQPHLAQSKKLYTAFGPIQTVQIFTQKPEHAAYQESLNMYKFILDSCDDGNSGYRTIAASICMHALDSHKKIGIDHLKKLVTDTFFNLFIQHDELFPKKIQPTIGRAIEKYLIEQLKKIETCKNIEQIRQLWNNEPQFDFYIIKFLKFLVVDYLNHHQELSPVMMIQHNHITQHQKTIASWGQEMTDLETTLLALATNITVSIQTSQSLTTYQATPEIAASFIFIADKHFQVVIPKKLLQKFLIKN